MSYSVAFFFFCGSTLFFGHRGVPGFCVLGLLVFRRVGGVFYGAPNSFYSPVDPCVVFSFWVRGASRLFRSPLLVDACRFFVGFVPLCKPVFFVRICSAPLLTFRRPLFVSYCSAAFTNVVISYQMVASIVFFSVFFSGFGYWIFRFFFFGFDAVLIVLASTESPSLFTAPRAFLFGSLLVWVSRNRGTRTPLAATTFAPPIPRTQLLQKKAAFYRVPRRSFSLFMSLALRFR